MNKSSVDFESAEYFFVFIVEAIISAFIFIT